MIEWEYVCHFVPSTEMSNIPGDTGPSTEILNALGKQGWEVCGVWANYTLILKRQSKEK